LKAEIASGRIHAQQPKPAAEEQRPQEEAKEETKEESKTEVKEEAK